VIYKLFLIIFLSNLYFSLDILKPTKSNIIDCHEPSDLAFDSSNSTFYCVSDEGAIYHFDKNLNLIKKFQTDLRDLESIYIDKENIYIIDERTRYIVTINKEDFTEKNRRLINYLGGSNKAFEGLVYNKTKDLWLVITEKKPLLFFELNDDFEVVNIIEKSKDFDELSAITFHDEFLWVLSDENRILYKISPIDYKIIDNWKVDVPTPEGLAFFADHLYIVSDNYNMIFDMGIIK
jgi:uncharacterized protein YjiK|tara:strand:- start:817 stop:1521 length:705 start_codon:yes stop_codon:yes gene_type:complete